PQCRRMLRPVVVNVLPKKELGQHFLIDENILGVIGRLAELGARDVVLEVGPGLGVLTRYLAERVASVHAVEVDLSLEPHLRDAGVELHFGDALQLDLRALAPDATKLVPNLPDNIATPLLVERLARVKQVVGAASAHRRKTLPNSLALASLASRERAASALEVIGRDAATRAEALAPPEFVALTDALR